MTKNFPRIIAKMNYFMLFVDTIIINKVYYGCFIIYQIEYNQGPMKDELEFNKYMKMFLDILIYYFNIKNSIKYLYKLKYSPYI